MAMRYHTAEVRKAIRAYALTLGEKYRITDDGEVHVYGPMPNSIVTGWWFCGYIEDVLGCGCCRGPAHDRCCCHIHQDISRGLRAHKCSRHQPKPDCAHAEITWTPDGHGAFCAHCGETTA